MGCKATPFEFPFPVPAFVPAIVAPKRATHNAVLHFEPMPHKVERPTHVSHFDNQHIIVSRKKKTNGHTKSVSSSKVYQNGSKTHSMCFGTLLDIQDHPVRKRLRRHYFHGSNGSLPTTISLEALQLPGVKDMYYTSTLSYPKSTHMSEELGKSLGTCTKNQKTLKKLIDFVDPMGAHTSVGEAALFERFMFGDSPHINSFANINFKFPSSRVEDAQNLHIRGSPDPKIPITGYQTISIISSICLYSADVVEQLSSRLLAITAFDAHRTPQSFLSDLTYPLTLNELDSISRLSNTIADFLCTMTPQDTLSRTSIEIILDIPRIQYYLSGPQSHFSNPLISETWMALIDRRKAQIEQLYTQTITSEIHRRRPDLQHAKSKTFKILYTEGLDPLLPLIRQNISHISSTALIPDCLDILSNTSLWFNFFALSQTPPLKTLDDLVWTSYVYELLTPFLQSLVSSSDTSTLILQVDNIVEGKPFLKAKRFLESYYKSLKASKNVGGGRTTLIGVYPSERIFYSRGGQFRSSLHKYDPGLEYLSGEDMGDSEDTFTPLDLLREVYGNEVMIGLISAVEGMDLL